MEVPLLWFDFVLFLGMADGRSVDPGGGRETTDMDNEDGSWFRGSETVEKSLH